MSVPFNIMPVDLRVPGTYVEISNQNAYQGLSGIPTRLLIVGLRLSTGITPQLEPKMITSATMAQAYFGRGSMLAHMCEKAFTINENGNLEIWAIAQDELVAGQKATGSIQFSGAATKSGMLVFYVAGRRVRVPVSTTDTPADIALNLSLVVTDELDMPVTAAIDGVVTSRVNFTARHKGEYGNDIDLRLNFNNDETTPLGLGVAITAMSGGTGNPDIDEVFAAIGDEWYTDFAFGYSDTANIAYIEDQLSNRFGPLQMQDGHAYFALSGTHADLLAKGSARNSPHITLIGANRSMSQPCEWAAILAATCAYEGKQDPARPFQTLALQGIYAPAITDRFNLLERDLLLRNGISTFTVQNDGKVRLERIITTYSENPLGASDPSFLDLNTVKTVTYLRYDLRIWIMLRFPRFKLADDGTKFATGTNVVTPKTIKGSIIARFQQWEEAGLVEGLEQFKKELLVERDASDPNRVNALVPPNVVNQLNIFAGLIEFKL